MAVAVSGDTKTVFVADPGTQCVHRFDLARGRYDRLFGERGEPLASPVGLTVAADGRIFVTDSAADVVYVAEPGDKQLRRIMLSPPPKQPTGVAFDDVSGHLFVSSTGSHMVRRYDATGTLLKDYGGRGEAAGEMNFPTYIWFEPPGELLVTDTMNFRIQRIDVEDGVLVNFGKAGDATGSLSRPKGVAVNRHGHIFVVDGGHHAMQVFDRNGQLLLAVGEQGQGAGQFWLPSGVFATADDLIFVADAFNGRVQVFRYLGDGL
jgi:sugar lactone lactonase YvrE